MLLNRSDYIAKSFQFLDGRQFNKLDHDPTKSFQGKVQRCLLKMKKVFDKNTYKRLYPSSSQPGLFFGLAKIHKLRENSNIVDDLPIRPVISNIGTATYEISKYLANLLSPLTKSEYTISSTKEFIQRLKSKSIDPNYDMVSFDVTSLFTNVPLNYTIEVILDKIFKEKLITTKLSRDNFKQLLELCTKEMHFSFNGDIYKQKDGVAMGNPLGPVLANIFMVELENKLVPTLSGKMSLWYRYVDDTFTFIKKDELENVKSVLNDFHEDIKFTHEIEHNNIISFLDVSVIKKVNGSFSTEVFRKKTDTNVYINWKAFAPRSWKIGTLKGLFRRAYLVCSETKGLNKELNYLKYVFTNVNAYPKKVVNSTLNNVTKAIEREKALDISRTNENPGVQANANIELTNESYPHICLPYKGREGENTVKKLKRCLNNFLPNEVIPRFTYKSKKTGSFFAIKDKIKSEHQTDLVYSYKQNNSEVIDYIGETNVRFESRIYEHCNTDKKSSVYKEAQSTGCNVSPNDFQVLAKGYPKTRDRKIAEALYIKEFKPRLNEQVASYKLKLFN